MSLMKIMRQLIALGSKESSQATNGIGGDKFMLKPKEEPTATTLLGPPKSLPDSNTRSLAPSILPSEPFTITQTQAVATPSLSPSSNQAKGLEGLLLNRKVLEDLFATSPGLRQVLKSFDSSKLHLLDQDILAAYLLSMGNEIKPDENPETFKGALKDLQEPI